MATKKKATETEAVPVIDSREMELEEALNKMKAEKEALLKEVEALKTEADKKKAEKPAPKQPDNSDYWNERVPYEAFYDGDKYSDDISVKVNGKRFLIKRGVKVMIPRYVLHVLENQAKQLRASADYNRKLKEEFERDTEKYLGE